MENSIEHNKSTDPERKEIIYLIKIKSIYTVQVTEQKEQKSKDDGAFISKPGRCVK